MGSNTPKLTLRADGFDTDDKVPDVEGGDQLDSTDDKLIDGFQDLLQQTQEELQRAANTQSGNASAAAQEAIQRCEPALKACQAAMKSGNAAQAKKLLQTYMDCVSKNDPKISGV